MFISVVSLGAGVLGLFAGGEWLVTGSSRLARSFGVSALIVGLTVVAFGTSAPELVISLDAAVRGSTGIALGNVVGSNIANIGLILALTALILPVAVRATLVRREIPIMIAASFLTTLLVFNGRLGRLEGLLLLVAFNGFNLLMYRLTLLERRQQGELVREEAELELEEDPPIKPERRWVEASRVLVGLAVLIVGARLTVDGAVDIAREVGVSELVIGITLVAVGTSLPELATSLVASLRKHNDIAIGNIVGSNIFNLLLILGATAMVRPIVIDPRVVEVDIWVMTVFAVALLPLSIIGGRISRLEAAALLVCYGLFILVTFLN